MNVTKQIVTTTKINLELTEIEFFILRQLMGGLSESQVLMCINDPHTNAIGVKRFNSADIRFLFDIYHKPTG